MNEKHLGDAKDFAKASLLDVARSYFSSGLRVLPLWTSPPTKSVVRTYARLLGCKPIDLVLPTRLFPAGSNERAHYIKEADAATGDAALFVDPDTGVRRTAGGPQAQRYVTCSELQQLCSSTTPRVVIAYDESIMRANLSSRHTVMLGKTSMLSVLGVEAFYYDGGSMPVLFCAPVQARADLRAMKVRLRAFLGARRGRIVN